MKTMLRRFRFLCLFVGVTLTACQENQPIEDTPEVMINDDPIFDSIEILDLPDLPDEPVRNELPSVEVSVYNEFPDEIDGCACYFAKSREDLALGLYVFMTNYEKLAFMSLDGEMRSFDLVNSENLEGGKLKETWSNENYDMVITTSQTGQIDETWQSTGTISIKPTGKKSTVIEVVGECGC